jgi:hypothetical protein
MLEIRRSNQNEVEISGTVDELRAVSRDISALVWSGNDQIAFEANPFINPAPYDAALKRMVIVQSRSPAKVSLASAEELRVEGSPESLEAFASYFDFEPGAAAGNHAHFEYYEHEGNRWVAPGSIPLVISVR